MTRRLIFVLLAGCGLVISLRSADPPAATTTPNTELDRLAVEVLKDLHNRGADLYNAADATSALRLYEGALRSVGPFLAHRPKVQAAIADGLTEAFKLDGAKAQAYRLHEVIDQARNDLKAAIKADAEAKPIEKEAPKAERKDDPKPGEKKAEPKPEPAPEPPAIGSLSGILTLDGVSVPKATITLVSLTLPKQQTFTTETDPDGRFAFPAELPAASYAVSVTSGETPIPVKFQIAKTSGLEVVVKAGDQANDVKLQSK